MGQALWTDSKEWTNLVGASPPHRMTDKKVYRLWSTISRANNGSYLKKTSSTGVSYTGTDGTSDEDLTLVTAYFITHTPDMSSELFRFVLKNPTNPSNWYVITGGSEGTGVYLQDRFSDNKYKTEDSNAHYRILESRGVYRFWSVVSRAKQGSYLKKTSSTGVSCTGTDGTADEDLTLLTSMDATLFPNLLYRFVLKNPTNPSNWYVLTGGPEGTGVYLQDVPKHTTPPKDLESRFSVENLHSTTTFRCYNVNGRKDLYIGSDVNGRVTMMKRGSTRYPNPAVLFRLVKQF